MRNVTAPTARLSRPSLRRQEDRKKIGTLTIFPRAAIRRERALEAGVVKNDYRPSFTPQGNQGDSCGSRAACAPMNEGPGMISPCAIVGILSACDGRHGPTGILPHPYPLPAGEGKWTSRPVGTASLRIMGGMRSRPTRWAAGRKPVALQAAPRGVPA